MYQADNDGTTPACIAAFNGHEETLRVLWEMKADLNQVDTCGCAVDVFMSTGSKEGEGEGVWWEWMRSGNRCHRLRGSYGE